MARVKESEGLIPGNRPRRGTVAPVTRWHRNRPTVSATRGGPPTAAPRAPLTRAHGCPRTSAGGAVIAIGRKPSREGARTPPRFGRVAAAGEGIQRGLPSTSAARRPIRRGWWTAEVPLAARRIPTALSRRHLESGSTGRMAIIDTYEEGDERVPSSWVRESRRSVVPRQLSRHVLNDGPTSARTSADPNSKPGGTTPSRRVYAQAWSGMVRHTGRWWLGACASPARETVAAPLGYRLGTGFPTSSPKPV